MRYGIHSAIPKPFRSPHYHQYGLHRGIIIDVIYPDDSENSTGDRLEYKIKVKGQIYRNVIDIRDIGGIYNYSETIRKKTEDLKDESVFDEKRDGEAILVGFLEGHGDLPIILGSLEHPRHGKYKKASSSNGKTHTFEYNGVEWKIDDDGTLSFEMVGKKDINGKIQNTSAVGSKITIDGLTGNVDVVLAEDDPADPSRITIGHSQAELLDLFDKTLAAIQIMTVNGNLGYPTSIPTNASTFIDIQASLFMLKSK